MDRDPTKFQSLSPSRPRDISRPRSRKSLSGTSLKKIPTAQSFDDHAEYSRSDSNPVESPEREKIELHETNELESENEHHEASSIDDKDIEKDIEKGQLEPVTAPPPPKDPFLVSWDGPDDPSNPKNWSMRQKWLLTVIVSLFTLLSPTSSSMVAPALVDIDQEFGIKTQTESAMVLSIFVLAYAVGPLALGPLSEVYGRVPILQITNAIYILFNFVCGWSRNSGELLAFRFLAGIGGSAPLAVGGALLGDMFTADQRARAVSLYSLAPLLGPAIGPIAGGFIAERTTWRWIFWSTSAFSVAVQCVGLVLLKGEF
jgi:multidrug resistance protein